MKRGWMVRAGWALASSVLMALAAPTSASGALQQSRQECRCVDADGDPIENCSCFRMPDVREFSFAPLAPRPRLGISVDNDQPSRIDAQGAEVTSVLEDGPAAEAGLAEGDIITRIDGRSLLSPLDPDAEENFDEDESVPVQRLLSIARGLEPGDRVEIEYLRDGERRTTTVQAEDLSTGMMAWAYAVDPERVLVDTERIREQAEQLREQARAFQLEWNDRAPLVVGAAPWVGGPLGMARFGVQMIELNEDLGAYFGAPEGVLVTQVDEDSTLGLRPGDVILRVGDRAVATPDRMLRLLATYEDGEEVRLRVRRNGSEIDVLGRVD